MISYAISDPQTLSFDRLEEDLQRFAQKADMIVYRDKTNPHYASQAKTFLKAARALPFEKVLLHGSVALAAELQADGVHLTSKQFGEIEYAKASGLFTIISCHTFDEARAAEKLGADMITFSPIFASPGKGEPLGLGALKALQGIISLPIIALGGIVSRTQIEACREAGASGFASIRYFQ
jgi:thiamine-phosphate pyrophosphorylase